MSHTLQSSSRNRNSRKKGFSLIELIIVISVMAAIATVIIPSITGATEAARAQRAEAAAEALSMAQVRYRLANGLGLWNSMTEAARFAALRPYLEYAPADLAAFEAEHEGWTFDIPALDANGNLQKVTVAAE